MAATINDGSFRTASMFRIVFFFQYYIHFHHDLEEKCSKWQTLNGYYEAQSLLLNVIVFICVNAVQKSLKNTI